MINKNVIVLVSGFGRLQTSTIFALNSSFNHKSKPLTNTVTPGVEAR